MTPQESREKYLSSVFSLDEVIYLEKLGLAEKYIQGHISIDDIYIHLREQGI
jgi:hypothetical protein